MSSWAQSCPFWAHILIQTYSYSTAALELKGIKREIAAYILHQRMRGTLIGSVERYFIVAKSHECSEVLDPTYTPGSELE